MDFIVYDIEATCWEGRPPGKVQEVIEIGAIKVNRYGELLDSFSRFVKPVLSPNMSMYCRQLTGIKQEEIDKAKTFPTVIEAFQDWIDIYEEDYVLCAWGKFDKKILIMDCELHGLDSDWVEPYMDVKAQYHEVKRLHKQRGFKYTVEKEGFDFTGEQHRAITDARNLAKVFVKYLDDWYY